jgi:tetratricopeptide (TPR) repeat protein
MTGIALLDVAAGRTRYAASQCEAALRLNPTHRVTLLTLAILNESLGDAASAEKYVELALKYHANSAQVHFIAGRFYYDVNNQYKAESHLKTALGLDGEYEEARMLLGNLYILMKNYTRAIEVLRPLLTARADNAFAYYSLGMAYWGSGDSTQALASLERAQRLKPDDEIIKLTLEQLAEGALPMQDPKRVSYATGRFTQGQLFETKNLYTAALLEYRRAVMLNPLYKDAHFALAGIYRKRGFPMKYLSILEAITQKNITDQRIKDDIEYYRTKAYGTVADKWQLDQHNMVIKSLAVSVFFLPGTNSSLHPTSDGIVASYFKDVLDGFDKMDAGKAEPVMATYEQAFRAARSNKSDYFLLFSFTESERSFRATCVLYLSRTGTELARFTAERTGNDRIRDTLLRIGTSLSDTLPLRGILLKKEFDNGVIDIGRIHGLAEKNVLLIVKQGKVGLMTDKVGFTYQAADVVGEITLTKVDEAVAEGTIAKKSFYDYASAGDEVLYLPQGIPKQDESASSPGSLLESLMILK